MNGRRIMNGLLAIAVVAAAPAAIHGVGFLSSRWAASAAERQPLYYKAPTGNPDYPPTPKKGGAARDYLPVYDEPGEAPKASAQPAAPEKEHKVLYYRNPMGLPD